MNQQPTKDGRPANAASGSDELFEPTLAELACVAGGVGTTRVDYSNFIITKTVDFPSRALS